MPTASSATTRKQGHTKRRLMYFRKTLAGPCQ